MNRANKDGLRLIDNILDMWGKKRKDEALTMCAKRKPTEREINRAMIIGKWFFGWTDKTGPYPINLESKYWGKKLYALFEWISTLESDVNNSNKENKNNCLN